MATTQVSVCNLALDHIGEKPVTSAQITAKAPKAARLLEAHWDVVLDEVLEAHPWNFAKKHWPLEYMAGFAEYLAADEITITGISQASPGIVTAGTHGFLTDYTIRIKDVVGMVEVNDRIFQVTKVTDNTVSLNNIDTAQYTAYTSAGSAVRMEVLPKYQDGGYTYKVPSDLLKPLSLAGGGEFEIIGAGGATNPIERILTTVEDAVLIGISTRTTESEWGSRFIKVLAARLAAEVAFPITKKREIEKDMWGLYQFHLGDSAVKDSKDSNVKPNTKDSWLVKAGYE